MTTDILQEIWLPVAGYEGAYEVSNFGNVRSLDRFARSHSNCEKWLTGKVLKTKPSGKGYRSVNLSANNVISTKYVHTLVAQAFIGDRPEGLHINHIDGNKLNNCVDNLEYCSPKDNARHAVKTGLRSYERGEKLPVAKLTEADIPMIRKRLLAGESQVAIAKDYGVHGTTIHYLSRGKTWSHAV
jgi:hypothetical protein